MMKWLQLILSVTLLCTAVLTEPQQFDNYKVYEVKVLNEDHAHILHTLERNVVDEYDFWNSPVIGRNTDIMVPPGKSEDFEKMIKDFNMDVGVKISNLQDLIDRETPKVTPRAGFGWDNYHTFDEIYAWLDQLLVDYADVLTNHIVGYTYEGREIRAGNQAIVIEGTIHAREWISSATPTWILNELLTSTDPEVMEIALQTLIGTSFPSSMLTDLFTRRQQNFDFMWMSVGASNDPCSETFGGTVAFSDPESRALRFAFHSYGKYILSPWGYTYDHVHNYDQLMQIGNAAAAAISQKFQTNYTVGSTAETLYFNSGSSRDYLKGVHDIDESYTIELRDTGNFGFVLPPEQILPNSLEMFDGVMAIVQECRVIGYLN